MEIGRTGSYYAITTTVFTLETMVVAAGDRWGSRSDIKHVYITEYPAHLPVNVYTYRWPDA